MIAGKDKTKVGKVTRVWRRNNKITVQGVNIKIKRVSILFYYKFFIQKIHKLERLMAKEKLIQSIYLMQVYMTVRLKKLFVFSTDTIQKLVKN